VVEIVCDTSPLLHLARIGRLELLEWLEARVLVPPAVIRELAAGTEMGLAVSEIGSLAWVETRAPGASALSRVSIELGPGEREVLALGMEVPDRVLILDDRAARRNALELGLAHTGTLGVLLESKRRGRIRSVATLIDELLESGFYIEPRIVATVLRRAGEAT